ncbi:MAG TPA: hypothetical protein VGK67_12200 [Myxococcales bacterium]
MRLALVLVVVLVGLVSAPAFVQPIRYGVSGEGIVLREQAFVLDVPARGHGDEAALGKARLRGKLRFENTRETAGKLILEVRAEESVRFEYRARKQTACFVAADPGPEEELSRLLAQYRGRVRLEPIRESTCVKMAPLSSLPRKGGPPSVGRLDVRHLVSVGGKVRKASLRWEGGPAECNAIDSDVEEPVSCQLRMGQVAEYRFDLPAKGTLDVDVADLNPLRSKQGCCSRSFEGSFASAGPGTEGRVFFAAPEPMAARCRTMAHGWAEKASRVGGFELFESGPASTNEDGWAAVVEVTCDVDDGEHVDHWPARTATVAAKAASSVLPSKQAKEGESAFGPAALVDGSMTPWCTTADAKVGEWVELELKEDVAAVSLAVGEGPQVFHGDRIRVAKPANPEALAANSTGGATSWRRPTRIAFTPVEGGAAVAAIEVPQGAKALTMPAALAKGSWRMVVTEATPGNGPICIGELDLVPVQDRRALDSSPLLQGLLSPSATGLR